MIEIPTEQGSSDWYAARLGIPTASNMHKIITPATRKFSKQSRGYAFRLVAEKLLNESLDTLDHIEHVQRGKDLEPQAVKMFEAVEDLHTAPVGFLITNDGTMGATPDRRIVGAPAFLEVKCPMPWVQLEYLIDGFGADYLAQVQCQIYVGEADWVARYAFHPMMPAKLEKTYRDDEFIEAMCDAIAQFNDMKTEIERKARESGFFEEHIRAGQLSMDELMAQAERNL